MWGACGWAVWGSTASPDVKRQSAAGPPVPCPAACTIVSSSSPVAFSSCFSAYGKKRWRPEHRAPAHPEDRKAIRCTRMCGCRPSPFCRRALLLPAVSSYTGMQVRRVLHLVDNGTASLAVLWCLLIRMPVHYMVHFVVDDRLLWGVVHGFVFLRVHVWPTT